MEPTNYHLARNYSWCNRRVQRHKDSVQMGKGGYSQYDAADVGRSLFSQQDEDRTDIRTKDVKLAADIRAQEIVYSYILCKLMRSTKI